MFSYYISLAKMLCHFGLKILSILGTILESFTWVWCAAGERVVSLPGLRGLQEGPDLKLH